MFQQWEKGREKTAFPIVFNYHYNRQKFENLDKADKKQTEAPIPKVPPPISAQDRKLRKRKSRSLERRRQPKNIELSDSDEDISSQRHSPHPPQNVAQGIDEVDRSVHPSTSTEATVTVERVQIEIIPDEIISEEAKQPNVIINPLRIDESSASASGPESHSQNVTVDVHEPDVVLEIREESDESPLRESSFRTKLTKDRDLADVPENEAETDKLPVSDAIEAATLVLVQECDINENVVLGKKDRDAVETVVEVDINHNDLTLPVNGSPSDIKAIESVSKNDVPVSDRFDHRRISESSRSSFDESDGMDTEPTYARVENVRNKVSLFSLLDTYCTILYNIYFYYYFMENWH